MRVFAYDGRNLSSFNNSFALFKDGSTSITGTVDNTGKVDML
jgi:hypothetical protein